MVQHCRLLMNAGSMGVRFRAFATLRRAFPGGLYCDRADARQAGFVVTHTVDCCPRAYTRHLRIPWAQLSLLRQVPQRGGGCPHLARAVRRHAEHNLRRRSNWMLSASARWDTRVPDRETVSTRQLASSSSSALTLAAGSAATRAMSASGLARSARAHGTRRALRREGATRERGALTRYGSFDHAAMRSRCERPRALRSLLLAEARLDPDAMVWRWLLGRRRWLIHPSTRTGHVAGHSQPRLTR
jgi:hypothetical protein